MKKLILILLVYLTNVSFISKNYKTFGCNNLYVCVQSQNNGISNFFYEATYQTHSQNLNLTSGQCETFLCTGVNTANVIITVSDPNVQFGAIKIIDNSQNVIRCRAYIAGQSTYRLVFPVPTGSFSVIMTDSPC